MNTYRRPYDSCVNQKKEQVKQSCTEKQEYEMMTKKLAILEDRMTENV